MKAKLFIIIFSVFVTLDCACQKRSRYEWCWALTHPIAALKVKSISKTCYRMYAQKKTERIPDHFSNGGKLDAYRHVFFMAAFAQKVKVKKLRKLGKAHEKGNYLQFKRSRTEDGEIPDSLGTVMDLHNNEIGLRLGASNKNLSLPELEKLALNEIAAGKALIMKRTTDGTYTDCDGNYTDLKFYMKTWSIPKCLVSSDYSYHSEVPKESK